jgi:type IV secretion system protein VirB10
VATEADEHNQIQEGTASGVPEHSSEKARVDFDMLGQRRQKGYDKRIIFLMAAVLIAGVGAIVVLLMFTIGQMRSSSTPVDESKVKADAGLQVDQPPDDSMASARAAALKQQQEQEEKARREQEQRDADKNRNRGGTGSTTANSTNASQVDRSAAQAPQDTGEPPMTPVQRKMSGGVVVTPSLQNAAASGATVAGGTRRTSESGSQSDFEERRQALLEEQATLSGSGGGGLGESSGSRTRGSLGNLSGTRFAPGKATLAPKGKYLLAHGTYTRCALYTEIVTDHPGIIDCRLTEPVYSADGSTMLADAGDRLTGEQSAEMKAGQVNVFTSWTEMDTQAGVRAQLDSLGAGPMGASGTEAWIDHHYMQRFGGAVMLSFIQDALQAAANTTQKSSDSGGYTVNNSEQNVESMAGKVLDNTINIPDTAHILPGTVMTVIVARDIDFSSVFENR